MGQGQFAAIGKGLVDRERGDGFPRPESLEIGSHPTDAGSSSLAMWISSRGLVLSFLLGRRFLLGLGFTLPQCGGLRRRLLVAGIGGTQLKLSVWIGGCRAGQGWDLFANGFHTAMIISRSFFFSTELRAE
jgi:hypothetical protein